MFKNNYKLLLFIGVSVILLLGVGSLQAIKSLTKVEEIQRKQEMTPKDTERSVDRIGIFAPGLELESQESAVLYTKEYGEGNFQVAVYKGYTLIIPPGKIARLDSVKEQVDAQVFAQERGTPSSYLKISQISQIRDVFEVKGVITYNAAMGAYTDDKGFQYNFADGELVNKQVGANGVLHAKFEQAYPHFKPGVARTATVSNEQAKAITDRIISKLFSADRVNRLKTAIRYENFGEARLGIIYGDKEVQILVDQVTGDVIHYSKIK